MNITKLKIQTLIIAVSFGITNLAIAKWPQDTPPSGPIIDTIAHIPAICDCKTPVVQCVWQFPIKRPISPRETLEETVIKKIETINIGLTYGTVQYEMPSSVVAKRIAEIFRGAGWIVKIEDDPRWITFAWDQSITKKP